MDLLVKDKCFILTGASSGLGFATAELLVAEGARVVISGRSATKVNNAVALLGEQARGVVADNSDPETAEKLLAAAVGFGELAGGLISVGGPKPGKVLEISDQDWQESFERIFIGTNRLFRVIALELKNQQLPGSVAAVLSTSVKEPIPGLTISNGLRPGLAMLLKNYATEFAGDQIRFNGLLPGRINTNRMQEIDNASPDPVAKKAANQANIPLGRYGEPAEFGRVASFLLSPVSSYLTSVLLPVDGGLLSSL